MFKVTDGKGFQMTFANGWTVSVQWGFGNYCDNYHERWSLNANARLGAEGSATAEIAAFNGTQWYQFPSDTVKGYCTPDEVADFIKTISAL